ncbi:Sapep family Mn(2+)-dependent dipeptidase [Thermobrachium celere]|uniref:Acetylornithine deacetylase/Succinyl-diaminopimelate desuccinylase and related deacylases n=1 Tax=Thermobrachium celere DSM 8682 TaxID=941824 RepID=R7RUL4_9CLOT|nr:Sapep family Mn(2+)-dependent dipeptidase [Thermobrachium celere]CDF59123.1 Acetylornithine deacetylase/Succinyl-diaminopimelate desuccinylase and related deacylases [Thermobrachium celere DSM 8682]
MDINFQIDKYKDKIIKDTMNLIDIPSISSNKIALNEALHYVINIAKDMGFKAYTVLDDRIGIVEYGDGEETLGILVHVDVVPEGDLNLWRINPFKSVIENGYILGRGAVDDKGPVISSLYAMKIVKDLGILPSKKVVLIIGTQEEVEWTDIRDFINNYPIPSYGFTPDGEFPMTNREKGYADVELVFKNDNSNILEITSGNSTNSIPDKAVAKVSMDYNLLESYLLNYKKNHPNEDISIEKLKDHCVIVAKGLAVHSAYPEKGINAISIICNFIKGFIENNHLINFISDILYNDFYGSKMGLLSNSEFYEGEYVGKNVISPTMLKTEGNKYKLICNLRTSYFTRKQDIYNAFNIIKDKYNFEFRFIDYLDPIYVNKNKKFIKALSDAYEKHSGLRCEYNLAHGTSYAKAIPNFVSFGPIFPNDEDTSHEVNEKISIENLLKCTKIYAQSIANIILSKESFID